MGYNPVPHIIHRQVFDLSVPEKSVETGIQERLKNAFYAALPRMEEIFSLYDQPGLVIRIDKIFLDLGTFTEEKLDDFFSSRLCDALSKAFRDSVKISQVNDKNKRQYPSGPVALENDGAALIESFSDHVSAENLVDKVEFHDSAETISQAFFYFLHNGVLPWWMGQSAKGNMETIFSSLPDQASGSFCKMLKDLFVKNTNALRRLLYQFSQSFIDKIMLLLRQYAQQEIPDLFDITRQHHFFRTVQAAAQPTITFDNNWLSFQLLLSGSAAEAMNMLAQHLARLIKYDENAVERISNIIKTAPMITYQQDILEKLLVTILTANIRHQIAPDDFAVADSEMISQEKDVEDIDKEEPDIAIDDAEPVDKFMYVDHAGLVILHPFLPPFFSGLGLLDDKRCFKDEESRVKAVHLLAFLATGEMNAAEPELPFCKFLCGIPARTAIIKEMLITAHEVNECEELLQAVIGHWTALKNTSVGGLREAFLQRKGKLDFREDQPVLFVETKALDILLEKLPWGISFVQLPWMDKAFAAMWN